MSTEETIRGESQAVFDLLWARYGDRLSPEMADGLRGAVDTVVKTLTALRSVKLANGDEPLVTFTPFREEG